VPGHVARLVVNYSALRRLVVDYFDYAARPVTSARRAARRLARRLARHRLLRLCRASGCLGTSRDSSSTTSPTPRVWLLRLVARLVASLIVDYFASRRLVVDYFAYATGRGATARREARHAARRQLLHLAQARCRLLRLRRASGCFGTSRGSSRGSLSTTAPLPRVRVPRLVTRLVVDYFDYAARPGPSARRAARRQLLHLLRASGCLGTSRGSSSGSSSTTSPSPRVRFLRLVT
jgi:hypothetical protein